MSPLDDPVLASFLAAVSNAARVTRHVANGLTAEGRAAKLDASPVTVADLAAQAVVARHLGFAVPLVAEESAELLGEGGSASFRLAVLEAVRIVYPGIALDEVRQAIDAGMDARQEATWDALDPIDGTKGYVRGGQYAIALARIADGRPTRAAMACPRLAKQSEPLEVAREPGCVFVAAAGKGTWEVDADSGAVAGVRATQARRGALRLAMSWESEHGDREGVAARLEAAGLPFTAVRVDSQAKYGLVARGDADAYVRLPHQGERVRREYVWDHAAGALVAAEAGARVTDLLGLELDFGCGRRLERNFGILCAAPWAHAALLPLFTREGNAATLNG